LPPSISGVIASGELPSERLFKDGLLWHASLAREPDHLDPKLPRLEAMPPTGQLLGRHSVGT
jgi:hypothetical protein